MFQELFHHLDEFATRHAGACVYELWAARVNDEVLRLVNELPPEKREVFLREATEKGFYDPESPAGWLVEATAETCVHGLQPKYCPAGCGDVEDY